MFSILLSDGRCLGRRASDASHTAASSDASSDASASADVVSFVPTVEDRARMDAATIAYMTDPEFEIVSVVSGIKFTQAELPFFDPNEVVPRFPSNTHSRYKRQPLSWKAVNILLQSAAIPQPLSQRGAERVFADYLSFLGIHSSRVTTMPGGGHIVVIHGRHHPFTHPLYYTATHPYALPLIRADDWMVKPCATLASGEAKEAVGPGVWFSTNPAHAKYFATACDLAAFDGEEVPVPSGWCISAVLAFEEPLIANIYHSVSMLTWRVNVAHIVFRVVRYEDYDGSYMLPYMRGGTCCPPIVARGFPSGES